MSTTPRFPTAESALTYRHHHDSRARALHRMTMPTLRNLERDALAQAGVLRVAGGPQSKDELERSILEREFPVAVLNETAHVLYHEPGQNWSACDLCGTP